MTWDPDEVVGEEINDVDGETSVKIDSDDEDDLQPYDLDDDMSDLYPNSRQLYLINALLYYNLVLINV